MASDPSLSPQKKVTWWSTKVSTASGRPTMLTVEPPGQGRRLRAALGVDPRSKDWDVETAGAVDLARAMIAGRTYAAIIVDGALEDVNALIEEVRAQPHARTIPIVLAGRRTALSRRDRRCWSVRIDDDNALRDTVRHVLDHPGTESPVPGPTTVRGPQIVGAEVVRSVAPTVAMADVVVAPRVLGTRRSQRPALLVPEVIESVAVEAPPALPGVEEGAAHPPTAAFAPPAPASSAQDAAAAPPAEVAPEYRKPPTLVAPLLEPGSGRRGRPRTRPEAATQVADVSVYRAACEATTACLLGANRQGECVFANTAGAALLGYTRGEDLVGRPLAAFFGADGAARVLESPVRSGPGAREHEVTRGDGTTFVAQVDRVAVPPVFGRLAWVLTLTDVTDRRAREASVLQAQKMEAVGQLTGGICHDFNNLLTVIVGNLREIAQEPAIPADLKEMAEDALSAAVDGVNLTRRLLAVAKERKLAPRAVELRQTLDDFVRLVRRMVKDAVQIEVEHGHGVVAAMLDRTQLESAVLNLVINAQNALPNGGTVRIAVDIVSLPSGRDELGPGRYARVRVSDDGVGMTEETRQRAMEPFFTTRANGGGSGLGLSMVYGFVQQSGGAVQIESAVGAGTTVTMLFPYVAEASPRTALFPERIGTAPRAAVRVLVVEDEERVRRYAARALAKVGYQVEMAEDGAAALAKLAGDQAGFALVITDVRMPGAVDGFAVAAWVRAHRPGTPVIVTTGYSPDEPARAVVEGPPLLRKPYTEAELVRNVQLALAPPPAET